MPGARYRLRQFWHYLTPAPLTATAEAQVAQWLPPPLLALFHRLTPGEQAHSLHVAQRLIQAGHTAPALLQAALLHDVGKCVAPLSIVERVLIVLVKTLFGSATVLRWGQAPPTGWRKPFAVAAQHPAWGADLAAAAGASPTVVALIRQHQDPHPVEPWLQALQAADDES